MPAVSAADGNRPPLLSLVLVVVMFPLISILLSLLCTGYLLLAAGPGCRAAMLAYLLWIYFDRAPARGGYQWARRVGLSRWLRRGVWWRVCARYFPASAHKTAELPAEQGPYVFACHPHGVFGVATQTTLGTDATGFDRLFPGVEVHLLGLRPIFNVPFFREWVLLHGHATPGAKTILAILRSGQSVALAPGGAHESLNAFPGTYSLTIRRGFVRVAMQGGAKLVPVVSYGENELYTQRQNREGSKLRWLQLQIKALCGFTLPLFCGQPWLPLLPKSIRLVTVVGPPVELAQAANPTEEQIDRARERYVEALKLLFEQNKQKYGYQDVQLQVDYEAK